MTTPAPAPPSSDPRWQLPQIAPWRHDAAAVGTYVTDEDLAGVETYFLSTLRMDGFTEITEDLLYVLWSTLPKIAAVTLARIENTCGAPAGCGQAAIMHASDAFDVFAAGLLRLESRIGEKL